MTGYGHWRSVCLYALDGKKVWVSNLWRWSVSDSPEYSRIVTLQVRVAFRYLENWAQIYWFWICEVISFYFVVSERCFEKHNPQQLNSTIRGLRERWAVIPSSLSSFCCVCAHTCVCMYVCVLLTHGNRYVSAFVQQPVTLEVKRWWRVIKDNRWCHVSTLRGVRWLKTSELCSSF